MNTSQTNESGRGAEDDPGEPGEPPAQRDDLRIQWTYDDPIDPASAGLPDAGWFRSALATLVKQAGAQRGEISVTVVRDQRMSELHLQHKGNPDTTDVLSFDLADTPDNHNDETPQSIDADLVICLDEAQRQAHDRGHTIEKELLLYALHGTLHMLGYDDLEPDAASRMHQRENELLAQAGFGEVYGNI